MLEDLFGFLDLQEQENQQLPNSLEEIMDRYIYYEGDCWSNYVNPFLDLYVDNPTMFQTHQTPLKVKSKIEHF